MWYDKTSNRNNFSLDIVFGSDGSSVTRFPPQSSTVVAAQENHHRFGSPTQQTFHSQAFRGSSSQVGQVEQGGQYGQGGQRGQGGQHGQGGQGGQGGKQNEHDEALRQNALHRQMLAEVEKKHREATQVGVK